MAGPRFEDRSAALAVAHVYAGGWEHFVGGGVAVFDCNGDNLPEIFAAGGENPARLFLNRSTPGGDILGLFGGQGTVIPPMACNRPAVICPAGPLAVGMGFPALPPCVEIDAYSTGNDWEGRGWPWVVVFSVDRTSVGFSLPRPLPPAQWSDVAMEAAAADAAADLFVSAFFLRVNLLPDGRLQWFFGTLGWNYLGFDGDGIQAAALPACYPSSTGLGLVEPSPPGAGDDLDGTDNLFRTFDFLTTGFTSPNYPAPMFPPNGIPVLGRGSILSKGLFFSLDPASAAAYGVSPADVLCTNDGSLPWVWAPAASLGLDPNRDDIDALAIWVSGDPSMSPALFRPEQPPMVYRSPWAFVAFSVSRNSAIVGTQDVLWNIPIMPSDILMPGDIVGFPGRVAILVPGSAFGLLPMLQRPPGVLTDNLDALQVYDAGELPGWPLEGIDWDSFPMTGPEERWAREGDVGEWGVFNLPPGALDLPPGPFAPSDMVPESRRFVRGDPNADGSPDISDGIYTLSYCFLGGPAPPCLKSADANDTSEIDISDAIWLLNFLFRGGPAPPAPYPDCGIDPTPDDLSCHS